jgi:hypothetical protein
MNAEEPKTPGELLAWEIHRANELTAQLIRNQTDWKLAFRNGLVTGFGTVVGATVLVSLLIWLLQPLRQLQFLKQPLDRIATELEQRDRR